ncbi:MAG: trigger factor [Eubacterium sp.]|nr:trigger factor [Eubacterium sp.]
MRSRKISAVLIGVMILSVLGGCGKKTEETSSIKEQKENFAKYVTLGTYKGVEYTPSKTEVTDEDIQAEIDSLIEDNTKEEQVKEGTATMGDAVNIDFVGYVDGEAFEGGDSQGAGYDLTLGSHSFIDDFEEQISGHKPGDEFEVNVTFPDDYGSETLAGKDALFKTTLNYIVKKNAPKYDNALIASATDYQTTKDFEAATRTHLEEEAAESDLSTDKNAVIQKVKDSSTVSEYPEAVVKARVDYMISGVTEAAESNGMDLSAYLSNFGYDEETFKNQVQESVEDFIRERMIMVAIAEAESIEVKDEEVEAKKQELMDQSGISDIETLKKTYGYQDDDFYYEVLYNKVTDFVYENAVPVEGTATDAEAGEMVDDFGTTEE